ncbi:ATP-binding protein [Actinomadura madurae]|uniref:ATP-binding protein n=1 Tax=Actinomadura madurae TaxID=1993 RepID=UPI0020D25386|nr:hypothetical protein [Actinomadura madurae]MCP9980337.1 hypothetical protein [Actinomadura madurae]
MPLLDGIPLAIELAAVRLSSMAVEEILDRLDDRFQPLSASPARARGRYRRTLRAVIGWSHGLCTEGERLLWARLSIFSGGFDLEAAEAVGAGGGVTAAEVADLLAGLVHKSIVMADGTEDRTRYRLLETIRRYGRQQLREAGAIDAFRLRHTHHHRDLTLRAAAQWCGPDEVDWLCRLRRDLPDLRGALESCATGPSPAAAGLDIVINLLRTRFWFFSGTLGEARHWLDQLATARPGDTPDERETAAAAMRAFLIIVQGDRRAVPEATAACRAAAAAHPCAPAVYVEGVHALLRGNDARSIALLARARAEFLAAGQAGRRPHGHHVLGHGRRLPGRPGHRRPRSRRLQCRSRDDGSGLGRLLGPVDGRSRRTPARRTVARAGSAARGTGTPARHRRRLGTCLGRGGPGVDGRRHRTAPPGRRPAGRRASATPGDRGHADRPQTVPGRPRRGRTADPRRADAGGLRASPAPGIGRRRRRRAGAGDGGRDHRLPLNRGARVACAAA